MILETEIAFNDADAEKAKDMAIDYTPQLIWRPGTIDLRGVEAYCVTDFNGEAFFGGYQLVYQRRHLLHGSCSLRCHANNYGKIER